LNNKDGDTFNHKKKKMHYFLQVKFSTLKLSITLMFMFVFETINISEIYDLINYFLDYIPI